MNEPITLYDFIPPIFFKIKFFSRESIAALTVFAAFVLGVLSSTVFPATIAKLAYTVSTYKYEYNQALARRFTRGVESYGRAKVLGAKTKRVQQERTRGNLQTERSYTAQSARTHQTSVRETRWVVVVSPEEDGAWVTYTIERVDSNNNPYSYPPPSYFEQR